MLVKRNVYFSAIDESGEERLYSTNEVISEEDYLEMLFSDNEDDEDEDEKKSDKNLAEKVGKGAMVAGGAGTAGAVLVPGTKASVRPYKEAISKLPGALKVIAKNKLGRKLTDKDIKKAQDYLDALKKIHKKAALQDIDTYARRASKVVKDSAVKNAKGGLAVTAVGAGLYAAGKLAKKKEKKKED